MFNEIQSSVLLLAFGYILARKHFFVIRQRLIPVFSFDPDENDSDEWHLDLLEDDRDE